MKPVSESSVSIAAFPQSLLSDIASALSMLTILYAFEGKKEPHGIHFAAAFEQAGFMRKTCARQFPKRWAKRITMAQST